MALETKVVVPEAPKHLPRSLQAKWREAYEKGLKQAQKDFASEDATFHRQCALREANRLQEPSEPANYNEAINLAPHEFIHREVGKRVINKEGIEELQDDGVLRVVTSHGKKFSFPVPKESSAPPAATAQQST